MWLCLCALRVCLLLSRTTAAAGARATSAEHTLHHLCGRRADGERLLISSLLHLRCRRRLCGKHYDDRADTAVDGHALQASGWVDGLVLIHNIR